MFLLCALIFVALLIVVAAFVSREIAWRECIEETHSEHREEMFKVRSKLLDLEAKLRRIQELAK